MAADSGDVHGDSDDAQGAETTTELPTLRGWPSTSNVVLQRTLEKPRQRLTQMFKQPLQAASSVVFGGCIFLPI
jgi:hypothetical protein